MTDVSQGRLVTLDGLRGVAAICVVLFHAEALSPIAMPGGYLAVDLFLVLSGYVIARSYGARIGRLGALGFFRVRFIRLYPLYLAGIVLGAAVLLLRVFTLGVEVRFARTVPALALLPAFVASGYLYPLNPPAWSLGFEALVNAVYGMAKGRVALGVALAAIMVAGAEITRGTLSAGHANLGADWATASTGLARAVFSFVFGLLLFRLSKLKPARLHSGWLAYATAPALIAVLAFGPAFRAIWDLGCIFVLFPALVLVGARIEPPAPEPFATLGDASYALYCIHYPVLIAFRGAITRLESPPAWAGAVAILLIFGGALLLHRRYDLPIRSWLRYRFGAQVEDGSADLPETANVR